MELLDLLESANEQNVAAILAGLLESPTMYSAHSYSPLATMVFIWEMSANAIAN